MTATTLPRTRTADPEAQALPLVLLGELALAGLALATVLSLRRVFVDVDWFQPLALQIVLAHTITALLRRRGVGLAPAIGLTVAAGAVVIGLLYASDFTTLGVPTPATFDALGSEVADALTAWSDVKAPTEALDGFLIATSVAIWLSAILADWAAFRVDAPLESTLPFATLFVLGAVLGADVDRVLLTGLWIAAALTFVLFRRAERLGRVSTWVGERRSTGPRTLVVLGVGLALAAVVIAAVLGPRLPGADSDAIVSLRDLGDEGPGRRVTVSPLVDIRSRLVDQASVEVFTVSSPVRSYWRLTSLDRFDGSIWSSNGSYGKASGTLDEGVPVASDTVPFDQAYNISALAQIWLPAAYEPQRIEVPQDVRYDEVSGTLIVDTDVETSDDLTYEVTSALPQHDPDALAVASSAVPGDIADAYLGLPGDFPASVRSLAQEVVAGSGSAYEASRRLQDFFRENFVYDLAVGAGHSERAMEQFVIELRRGYCEQFAGTFAAMARAVGIPARVAVGFTPGESDPSDPNLYRVRGEHAHAWPEVYLGEYGWVAFEPTPGRGAPFAEQYTGVTEQQDEAGGDGNTPTTAVSPPSTEPGPASPSTTAPVATPDDLGELGAGGAGSDEPDEELAYLRWLRRLATTLLAALGAALVYLLAVDAVTDWRRHRRHRAADDAERQVALAWEEAVAALDRAGVRTRAALTESEVAARVEAKLPSASEPVRSLASTLEQVTYAPRPAGPEAGIEAQALAAEIERIAGSTMTGADRLRARFHPRNLVGG